jgi:hypothetical protein
MRRATVHVDLGRKSCVILDSTGTPCAAWAPGVTRSNTADRIASDGWQFADDSEWRMTIDGGVREVIQADQPERAVFEHTAHSAIAAGRALSGAVVASYTGLAGGA